MESSIVKALLSYGGLGVSTLILLYICLKCWKQNQDIQKEYSESLKELTNTYMCDSRKQTEVIVKMTEVLRHQERTLDTYMRASVRDMSISPIHDRSIDDE